MDGNPRRVSAIFIAQESIPGAPLSQKTRIDTRRCSGRHQKKRRVRMVAKWATAELPLSVESWPSKDQLC